MTRLFFKRIIFFALLMGAAVFLYWNYFVCQTQFDGHVLKNNKPLIVFDFDGTVADSWPHIIKIMNRISPEYGFKQIPYADKDKYRNIELKQVLKGLDIGSLRLPFVVKRVRKEIQKDILNIKMVPGMKQLLDTLKNQGYNLGIVTSNSVANTKKFLKHNNVGDIDFIYSSTCVGDKDKLIKDVIQKSQIDPENIYYVGDEVRDIEAAQKTGVKSIAVTWGFSSKKLIEQSNPDYLINDPMDLPKFLN